MFRALSCQKLQTSPSTIFEEDRISMRTYWFVILLAVTFVPVGLWGQSGTTAAPGVLHILQSQTTSQPGFPTFLGMYHVLDGANSPAGAIALSGTLSLTNSAPRFSEVLW